MITHALRQNSPEWGAHRACHDNASELAAAMGLSKTTTRNEALHAKHTGIGKEFSPWVQTNVLDHGHEVEAKVRALVEGLIGEGLYAVTCSEGRLSASLDGLNASDEIAFECKQWNTEIAAQVAAGIMPEQHMPQCQQILLITGARTLIFAVGDGTAEKLLLLDVLPDPVWFERIHATWAQWHVDCAAYVPVEAAPVAIGRAPETLPALRIILKGEVSESNLSDFREIALAAIRSVNRDLQTDQDFADSAKARKWCQDIKDRVAAAKSHALSQTATIDELFRTLDEVSAEADAVRLELEKLEKARTQSLNEEIVLHGKTKFSAYMTALNAAMPRPYMPQIAVDFGAAIKGLRTVTSKRNAVSTELARVTIIADGHAARIRINLATLRDLAKDYPFLFSDTAQIVLKDNDDFALLVQARIDLHRAAEAKREADTRERIRAEEQAKAEAAVREAVRVKAEAAALAVAMLEAAWIAESPYRPAPLTAQDIADGVVDAELSAAATAVVPMRQAEPVATPTSVRERLNAHLDRLQDHEIQRVLSFVQSRFKLTEGTI